MDIQFEMLIIIIMVLIIILRMRLLVPTSINTKNNNSNDIFINNDKNRNITNVPAPMLFGAPAARICFAAPYAATALLPASSRRLAGATSAASRGIAAIA